VLVSGAAGKRNRGGDGWSRTSQLNFRFRHCAPSRSARSGKIASLLRPLNGAGDNLGTSNIRKIAIVAVGFAGVCLLLLQLLLTRTRSGCRCAAASMD